MKEENGFLEFEAIDILEEYVGRNSSSDLKKEEEFPHWLDWVKETAIVPPIRDKIVSNNSFVCNIYYFLKETGIDMLNHRREIIADLVSTWSDIDKNIVLADKLEREYSRKHIQLRDLVQLKMLLYLHFFENNLTSLLTTLLRTRITSRKILKIEKEKRNKLKGTIEFRDSDSTVPSDTRIDLKLTRFVETKEISTFNQLSSLTVREIERIFKDKGFDTISQGIRELCNYELRNEIAHGKYSINPYRKEIHFNARIMRFSEFDDEDYKLYVLLELIFVGITLSFIIVDYGFNVNDYKRL